MDTQVLVGVVLVVVCLLPVALIGILGVWFMTVGRKWMENSVEPNVDKLYARYTKLYEANPDADLERHVRRIVHEESVKCGMIGAITGLGGFFVLPIALPLDIVLSMRIQVTLVQFIAKVYGIEEDNQTGKMARYLIMSRGSDVTNWSIRVIMRYVVRFMGKSFAKLVPVIGALISFFVNYVFSQASGRAAMVTYARQQRTLYAQS